MFDSSFDFTKQFQSSYRSLQEWLTIHWRILIVGIFLPLLVFGILALKIGQSESGLSWDASILLAIHATARQPLDRLAGVLTQTGTLIGTSVLAIPVVFALGYQQKRRSLAYLITTIVSSTLINRIAKLLLHRVRPHLWESFYPLPSDFSFPSGHAMASMTLVMSLVILTWGSRWCWLAGMVGGLYAIAIGWTRLYLGVHFPSDILAGWLLSLAWTVGMSLFFNLRKSEAVIENKDASFKES